MLTPRELGRIYRHNLEEHLRKEHGLTYGAPGGEWIRFRTIKFLAPYSRCHPTEKAYFYGVSKQDWDHWGQTACLILIIPKSGYVDEVSPEIRYIILSPGALHRMLPDCSSDEKGNKKVMVYTNGGAIDLERPSLMYVKQEVQIQKLAITQ
jgi:hypothetical protein